MTRLPLLLGALGLIAASCGDDGGSEASAVADAIAAEMTKDGDISTEDAQCIGSGVVDAIGEDELASYGITADSVGSIDEIDNLTEDDATAMVNVMLGCADLKGIMIAGMLEGAPDPAATEECLNGVITDDVIRDFMVVGLTGGDAEQAALADSDFVSAVAECAP